MKNIVMYIFRFAVAHRNVDRIDQNLSVLISGRAMTLMKSAALDLDSLALVHSPLLDCASYVVVLARTR